MEWMDFIDDIQSLLESLDADDNKDDPIATIDAWTGRDGWKIKLTSHSPKHISITLQEKE